jgi:S1-C subfamily serine protease
MSTPAPTLLVEPGNAGHPHLCHKDHNWQHAGPTAEGCALPTVDPETGLLVRLSVADCAVCAGRDDLLTRPPHSHHCSFCEVEWTHEGRCAEGLLAWCPWDLAEPNGDPAPGTRIGRHFHYCPACGTHWAHLEQCAAPLGVVLPVCPGCGTASQKLLKAPGFVLKRGAGRLQLGAWWAPRGRWVPGAIAGVAAIILVALKLLPINSADWLAPVQPHRVVVAPPLRSAEPVVGPSPQAVPAPPAEPPSSAQGEGTLGVEETGAGDGPRDPQAGSRDRSVPTPDEARSRTTQGRPSASPLPPVDPRGTESPPPRAPVALPPHASAPMAAGALGDRSPEQHAGIPRTPGSAAQAPRPWVALPPAPPLSPAPVVTPPASGSAAPPAPSVPSPPLRPSPTLPPVAGPAPASPPRAERLSPAPVLKHPEWVATAPGPGDSPRDRVQDPASETRGASAPAVTPPASGSAAPPAPSVPPSPPLPPSPTVPPVASPAPASPPRAERPLSPGTVAPSPPLATAPGASASPNGGPQLPADSRFSVPFARGAPVAGAASGGGTPQEARRVLEARARNVPDPAFLLPSTAQPGSRTIDAARRAVVRVAAFDEPALRSGHSGPPSRSGFGFVVNENGIVLTARRLVTDATKVGVVLPDGRMLPVTTVAIDPLNDLAVLLVKAGGLRAVPLGSSGELRVGDPVIALGGPVVGATAGTLRATGAATGGDLVTDARATGQPRAGLPLLNVRGEAVGLLTHTSEADSGTALEFAVPIDRAKRLLRDLGPAAHGTPKAASPDVTSDR